jgi:hypothetical protein
LLLYVFAAHHAGNPLDEVPFARDAIFLLLGRTFRLTLYYLAMEPFVRRIWPTALISWTRAVSGGWRDPLVGRDLLY